jgi:type II secretory pathway predicted ATPase ExeA
MSQLLDHFGLKRHPFARSAAKDGLLRHRGFEEALGRLRFTVELDGIAILIAEAGCGKSLLLGELAGEQQRDGWMVHYFAHSTVGPFSLVNVLARKAGINPLRSRGETAVALSDHLMADERKHLLVLDEAHELPDDTIEDLRLLTITDFDRKSPFLLLLAGHPALDDRLAEPTHHALDQRVTTVARLSPLSLDETRDYLHCRLVAAGAGKQPVYEEGAIDAVFDTSGGVPRRINNIATSALIVAASRGRRLVTEQDVHDARLDRGRP